MSETISSATEAPKRRWVGVVLSLFVPGFGLIRTGRIWRGVAWLLVIQVIGVLATLLAIWRSVPFCGVLAGLVIALGWQLAMLVDSFRPGRLNARLCLIFIAALLAIILLPSTPHLFAHAFVVSSDGMAPTLRGRSCGTADHVIADRICYTLSPPKRGELVVFHTTGISDIPGADTFFIQRLVGLPGEKIEIHRHVFADGRQLDQSDGIPDLHYTTGPARSFMTQSSAYQVPQDTYFMLGDNSSNSFDSRYWGYLPKPNIYARVSRIYYPFSRAAVPR